MIAWRNDCIPFARLSFTVAINLPTYGGGLNWMSPDPSMTGCEHVLDISTPQPTKPIARCFRKGREEYSAGSFVLHTGYTIHAVGDWPYYAASEPRITMQVRLGARSSVCAAMCAARSPP